MPANCTLDVLNDYCEPVEDYIDRVEEHLAVDLTKGILVMLYIIVFFVGAVGNFMVCFAVLRTRELRTVTNVFLVNLAVADFLVIVICMGPTIVEDIRQTWYFGRIMCKVTKYLQHVSIIVSVLTLTGISFERFFAICYPLKFKATMKRAIWLIILIWVIGLGLGIIQGIAMEIYPDAKLPPGYLLFTSCDNSWDMETVLKLKYFELGVLFVAPFLWMSLAYGMISYRLWSTKIPGNQHTTIHRGNARHPMTPGENQTRGRRRAALMLIAVVIMFFICYLPVHLIRIIRSIFDQDFFDLNPSFALFLTKFAWFSHWLCFFNSAVNPVIYNFMSIKFKRAYKEMCICRKYPEHQFRRDTTIAHANRHYAARWRMPESVAMKPQHITQITNSPPVADAV